MKKPVVDLGEYQINKNYLLGEGSAGSVYYGEHKTQGYKVAAKQININKLTPAIEKQIEN